MTFAHISANPAQCLERDQREASMTLIAVILAIACCLALAGAGSIDGQPRRPRTGGEVAIQGIAGCANFCAQLNELLLKVAVALAVVVAALSTREGSQWASLKRACQLSRIMMK